MKHTKIELLFENRTLQTELAVRDFYLSCAFRSEVTHIAKGPHRLSICGEKSANGGVVLHSQLADDGKRYVIGVYYWESWFQRIRSLPLRHDDKEGHELRTCAEAVARHMAQIQQTEFREPVYPLSV